MELINRTPLVGRLLLGGPMDGHRMGMLVAKATYRIGDDGEVALDADAPVPIFDTDFVTPLGLLPRDDLPHPLDCFEVLLLGVAHVPRAVTELVVELAVGDVRRKLRVIGDRKRAGATVTAPEPFTRKALTWSNAYGGTARVWIDRDAVMDVPCSHNAEGRGFDPRKDAEHLGNLLGCPEGYPKVEWNEGMPNLEPFEDTFPGTSKTPACWAPIPAGNPINAERSFPGATVENSRVDLAMTTFLRAHPDWVIDLPSPRAKVELKNASAQPTLKFRLPALRAIVDFAAGSTRRRRELVPMLLVILPETRQFYLVFKRQFRLLASMPRGRAFRLRVAEGWRGSKS
jgi:hypothetical protein